MELCPRCLVTSGVVEAHEKGVPSPWAEQGEKLMPGQRVGGGRFTLIDQLGEGGMGVVWLAMDNALSEGGVPIHVALKFLAPRIRTAPGALVMMRDEVLQSRKLRHPSIVSIYDWHAPAGEPPFISMEYVEGVNLSQLLKLQPGGRMSWVSVAPWVRQLCDALAYAHTQEGIVHRDLKPGNLMLNQESQLKLADFGLARRFVEDAGAGPDQTQVRGTPLYMSPQQMTGKTAHPSDDIYALGATLYQLLTGTPPFHTGDIFSQVLYCVPEPIGQRLTQAGLPDDVPGRVKIVVAACLEKKVSARPPTVRQVAHRLGLDMLPAPALRSAPPVPPPSPPPETQVPETDAEPEPSLQAEPEAAPRPRPWAVALGLILALVLAVIAYASRDKPPFSRLAEWTAGVLSGTNRATPSSGSGPGTAAATCQLTVRVDPAGALVVLTNQVGEVVRRLLLDNRSTCWFRDLPPGRYILNASLDQHQSTNVVLELLPGPPAKCALTLLAVAPASEPDTTHLALTYPRPDAVHFRLRETTTAKVVMSEGLFVRETNLAVNFAPGAYLLEAGIPTLEKAGPRMNQRIKLTGGTKTVEVSFQVGEVHLFANEPAHVTLQDHWGARREFDLSKWRLLGTGAPDQYHKELTGLMPGEFSCRLTLPGYEPVHLDLLVSPGSSQLQTNKIERSIAPTLGYDWTNSLGMTLVCFPNRQFWASATETTVADFARFATNAGREPQEMLCVTARGWTNCGLTWRNPGFVQQANQPVIGVSWADAMDFCKWLTDEERRWGRIRTNQNYRLPTDAQWSATAGLGRYPWGPDWPPDKTAINCAGEEARTNWFARWPTVDSDKTSPENYRDEWERTAPVNAVRPNAQRLYHLGGNAAEWCLDWYRASMNRPELLQAFPLLTSDSGGQAFKVVRGGSWYDHHPDELATDTRQRASPEERNDRVGFRVVLVEADEAPW